METGGLFLMEGARRPEVPFARVRLSIVPHDFAPRDLSHRQAGAQFIQKTGRQTHLATIPTGTKGVEVADNKKGRETLLRTPFLDNRQSGDYKPFAL